MTRTAILAGAYGVAFSAFWSGPALALPAETCVADGGADRAMCVAMIGAERQMLSDGKTVCSQVDPNDLSDTYAVIDFIRANPDRQGEELGAVTEEVLKKMHPCN